LSDGCSDGCSANFSAFDEIVPLFPGAPSHIKAGFFWGAENASRELRGLCLRDWTEGRLSDAVSERGAWQDWLEYFLQGIARMSEDAVSRATRINDLLAEGRRKLASESTNTPLRVIDLLAADPFITITGVADRLGPAFTMAQRAIERLGGTIPPNSTGTGVRPGFRRQPVAGLACYKSLCRWDVLCITTGKMVAHARVEPAACRSS
jgi:hypothetical protein